MAAAKIGRTACGSFKRRGEIFSADPARLAEFLRTKRKRL